MFLLLAKVPLFMWFHYCKVITQDLTNAHYYTVFMLAKDLHVCLVNKNPSSVSWFIILTLANVILICLNTFETYWSLFNYCKALSLYKINITLWLITLNIESHWNMVVRDYAIVRHFGAKIIIIKKNINCMDKKQKQKTKKTIHITIIT